MHSSNLAKPALVEGSKAWPRSYLSWSQYECWVGGRGNGHYEYFRRYLYGQPLHTTPQMRLGSEMHAMLDNRDIPQEDQMFEHYRHFIPKYEHTEEVIIARYGSVKLLAKPDGFNVFLGTGINSERAVMIDLAEIKTGSQNSRTPWTQERADTHRQIDLYMLVLEAKYDLPPSCIHPIVHWIPTYCEIGTGETRPTGEIFDYPTPRTEGQLIESGAEFIRIWHEIGEVYGEECRANGLL